MDPICKKSGNPCRHCSNEEILNVSRVGVIKTGQIERRETRIKLGQFCNNDGRHFVRDLPVCPVPGVLAVPLLPLEDDPLTWMRRRS